MIASPRSVAKRGAPWTRAQALKNACLRGILRGACAVADRLPAPLLVAAGRILGRIAMLLPRLRHTAMQNVESVFGRVGAEEVVHRCFINAGETLARTLLLRRASARASSWVELDGENLQRLVTALTSGHGALVLSAHYGPFEHIAAVVAEHGIEPSVLVRESYDPGLDALVDRHRLARGVAVVHRGRRPTGVLGALRRGHPVGLLVDLAGRVETAPVRFLGDGPTGFPTGPERLRARLGVPVLTALLEPKPTGGFRLVFRREDGPAEGLTQRVADELARHIRAFPEHWLWMARPLAATGALR